MADYRRELDQADASALEMQARRFEFGQARRKVREADEAAQAEARRQNALAALLQESGGDSERFTGLLERSGVPAFFEMAQKRKGEAAEAAKKAADIDKAKADTRATEVKTKAAEREQSLKDFMRLPDAASVAAFINADTSLPMQARQQLAASVPQDPAQLAQWKLRLYIAATEPEKALPKMETRDAGGSVETLRIDPISGEVQPANTVAKTQTPDNKASNARMAADAAANRAVQI
ncbi:MAG: hypothetical protein ACRCUC_03625, partial [Aestuariivirga sp.]